MSLSNKPLKIIECPRDAMQGLKDFIPTEVKANYINLLLKAGFDTLDFGSFVSPKAIPQMRDTAEVLSKLDLSGNPTKLLAIVANSRGAEDAAAILLLIQNRMYFFIPCILAAVVKADGCLNIGFK